MEVEQYLSSLIMKSGGPLVEGPSDNSRDGGR